MTKRLFDLISATVGLIILSPLLLTVALLVRLSSAGPVFYKGIRTGLGGVPFAMYKFRTMVVNAEALGGPSTGKGDSRITPVGHLLRRYKLDELPQLLNVVRGEMSIVGPRPEVPQYTREYRGEELLILTVRPGITDYASLRFSQLSEVLGGDDPDRVYEEKVKPEKNALRVKYVKERSMLLDLKLIFQTLFRVVRG